MSLYHLELFADYCQFRIQDERATDKLPDAWTNEAVERLLAVAPGAVGVGTVRNTDVPVTIEILEREPECDAGDFDHIVECSIALDSGVLVAAGTTDYLPDAKRIDVTPGSYRVRVCFAQLDTVSDDQLDGSDQYHLKLWPAAPGPVTIVKQRS